MLDKMQPLFHVGYEKTRTTTLQRQIFPHLEGYVGGPFNPDVYDALQRFLRQPSDGTVAELRKLITSHHDAPFLSSGQLVSRLAHLRSNRVAPAYEVMRFLRRVFPSAMVLITIRRQSDLIRSSYSQALKKGCTWTFSEYVDFERALVRLGRVESMNFLDLYDLAVSLFGAQNTVVIASESVCGPSTELLKRLSDLLRRPIVPGKLPEGLLRSTNPSRYLADESVRRANRIFRPGPWNGRRSPESLNPLQGPLLSHLYRATRKIGARVGDPGHAWDVQLLSRAFEEEFKGSNSELGARARLDLHAYGYCVADPSREEEALLSGRSRLR